MGVEFLLTVSSAGHESSLVRDFALTVVGASIAGMVFKLIRLPVVFGFILAGIILGPKLLPVPLVGSPASINELSELGVIFLLFFIGMEFDLGRLRSLFGPALLALLLQSLTLFYMAQIIGSLMGWDRLNLVFFGSVLVISSSMVTIRLLREQGLMERPFAQAAIAILVLEDVLAVVLLALLTGIAVSQEHGVSQVGLVFLLISAFAVAVFIAGRVIAPRFFTQTQGKGNTEEIRDKEGEELVLASMGLALGVSLLALEFDFSPALGAFLAGAVLSQTRFVHAIVEHTRSLHDVFAAVFFVSVGMQMDLVLLLGKIHWVVLLTVVVILIKVFSCWLGLSLGSFPPREAWRAALAKSQIGEFSFVIVALGQNLNVLDSELVAIVFGVALLTILLTPVLNRYGESGYVYFESRQPEALKRLYRFYCEFLDGAGTVLGGSLLLQLLRRPLLQVSSYILLETAVLAAATYSADYVESVFPSEEQRLVPLIAVWTGAAVLSAPWMIALIRNLNAVVFIVSDALFSQQGWRPLQQGRLRGVFGGVIEILVILLVGAAFIFAAFPYFPSGMALGVFAVILIVCSVLFWRQMIKLNSTIEYLFMESFTEYVKEAEDAKREEVLERVREEYPWHVEVLEVTIPRYSTAAGLKIRDLDIRKKGGGTIVGIRRGDFTAFNPGAGTPIFAGDKVVLVGSRDEHAKAQEILLEVKERPVESKPAGFQIEMVYVTPGCELDDNTLASADLRRRFGINVIGIQRGSERITAPRAEVIVQGGDVLYVLGDSQSVERFRKECLEKRVKERELETTVPWPI